MSHKRIIHFRTLEPLQAVAQQGGGFVQSLEQDETDMKLLKTTLPLVGALTLAGCIDGGGGGTGVTRAPTAASSCGYLHGLSAQHLEMIGSVRCGPQTELPYTYAN
ncbi:hypothetical protein SAMN04488515_2043 [Cognatiyoonia koreensis]|uniref:Uncharacterized protein n=1 Tax=Cognatiyoonia koreensis TaxID=364200 RepID=A0A1I0QNI4_9RHOB|nr:hypothetical protein [Cognatiyoonia koreensis]SEW28810.1 hypothetical protein SAMN04488515_2043 [Cognatiyoonia koreensis]